MIKVKWNNLLHCCFLGISTPGLYFSKSVSGSLLHFTRHRTSPVFLKLVSGSLLHFTRHRNSATGLTGRSARPLKATLAPPRQEAAGVRRSREAARKLSSPLFSWRKSTEPPSHCLVRQIVKTNSLSFLSHTYSKVFFYISSIHYFVTYLSSDMMDK